MWVWEPRQAAWSPEASRHHNMHLLMAATCTACIHTSCQLNPERLSKLLPCIAGPAAHGAAALAAAAHGGKGACGDAGSLATQVYWRADGIRGAVVSQGFGVWAVQHSSRT